MLINQLLKLICKVDPGEFQSVCFELAADLINCVSVLSKLTFTRQGGIEPVYMKNFLPLVSFLLSQQQAQQMLLATLKCLGTLICEAGTVPTRSLNFFKEIAESQVDSELSKIILEDSSPL